MQFTWVQEPDGWGPPSGPFGEPVYPIDDAIWFFLESTRHSGSVTVTYEYSVVPEPAMVSVVAMLGLRLARGRRSR
jgi:hypothetical protein